MILALYQQLACCIGRYTGKLLDSLNNLVGVIKMLLVIVPLKSMQCEDEPRYVIALYLAHILQ